MEMNISEKILARASGLKRVHPGDIVKARIDIAMMPDLTAILSFNAMREMGKVEVWDRNKIVLVLDHVSPASSIKAATIHRDIRRIVEKQQIQNFYDVDEGVCHQVLAEKGHVKPGMLIVGSDSHTCTHGALGAFSTGIGSTDMGAVLATGRIWLKVPESIRVVVEGTLPDSTAPKDVILHIIGQLGADGATYKAVEFTGSTIKALSVAGRMTLCNMTVEMGAKTGIIEPDEKTLHYLKDRAEGPFKMVKSDADAKYEATHNFHVGDLDPMVACPDRVDNVKPVSQVEGTPIDQVFIGSCTNGRIEDLEAAASILKDGRVHSDVRLIVTPASREVYQEAMETGILRIILNAGGLICNPSCGACFGGHLGILAPGEVGLATSNRNFRGRQGSSEAQVYLSSPATAAASAVNGFITDPRGLR